MQRLDKGTNQSSVKEEKRVLGGSVIGDVITIASRVAALLFSYETNYVWRWN